MKSISAVINARLQSTRVSRKLVRPFAGVTLLDIALARLNQIDFFDHRYLAVAEEELNAFADKYENIEILHRDLAAVRKGVNPQSVTFAHYLKVPSDHIFVLNPCLPLVSVETIRKAFDYFQSTHYPSYTSVIPTTDWYFDDQSNLLTRYSSENGTTQKQPIFYKAAHAFHIVDKSLFREHGYHWSFTKNDPHCIEIPESEAIDVDTELEFQFAEFFYAQSKAEQ